jgi:hypothetical protein
LLLLIVEFIHQSKVISPGLQGYPPQSRLNNMTEPLAGQYGLGAAGGALSPGCPYAGGRHCGGCYMALNCTQEMLELG